MGFRGEGRVEKISYTRLTVNVYLVEINMKTIYAILLITATLITGACSGDKSNTGTQENAFKTQTDAMKKAKQVESEVMKQAQQQQQAVEQQTR